MGVEIDLKKATNIYESMLIKVYNEYLVKVTDDDYIESVRESITQDLIKSEIKDIHSLAPKLKDYLDDCFYIGGLYPYIGLISYDKNNVQEKYDAYAEYNGNLLDEELIDITSEGVSLPLGVNVMYLSDDENINKLFNELVYKKMQENIKNEHDLLEFKVETDDEVYTLLISGEIQFNSIDKL